MPRIEVLKQNYNEDEMFRWLTGTGLVTHPEAAVVCGDIRELMDMERWANVTRLAVSTKENPEEPAVLGFRLSWTRARSKSLPGLGDMPPEIAERIVENIPVRLLDRLDLCELSGADGEQWNEYFIY